MQKEEKRKYYYIYFNDNKGEKYDYLAESDKAPSINIIIDYQVKSLERLFSNFEYIESITFKKFYGTNITDINNIFLIINL